YVLGAAAI
ncbi:type II secretion system (T2SS), N family protein, partial [Vibrio parahaemolyticus V-223/04]